MTATSDRRAVEQAVIEAARAVLQDASLYWTLGPLLADLDAIPLELPTTARTSRCAPVTAKQAGIWMDGERAQSMNARIVRLLSERPYLTAEQIQVMLGGKHQTVSARIHDLAEAGWIVDTGAVMTTTSGRDAIVWRLSYAAHQAINGQGEMI